MWRYNMLTVKVKYRGDWRKVIGMRYDNEGNYCYMVLSADARYYNLIPKDDKHITDKEERNVKKYPTTTRRYKELSEQEKESISIRFHSGHWTLKDICDMYKVTRLTVQKIVGVL